MKMNNKIIVGVAAVLIISGSFYAGTKYASAERGGNAMRANFAKGIGSQAGQKGMRAGGGMVGGEVISKDAQSITVKSPDEGSKIIFLSANTPITKTIAGTLEDVIVGGQVQIAGDQNPDGSVTAKSVQLRTGASVIK